MVHSWSRCGHWLFINKIFWETACPLLSVLSLAALVLSGQNWDHMAQKLKLFILCLLTEKACDPCPSPVLYNVEASAGPFQPTLTVLAFWKLPASVWTCQHLPQLKPTSDPVSFKCLLFHEHPLQHPCSLGEYTHFRAMETEAWRG